MRVKILNRLGVKLIIAISSALIVILGLYTFIAITNLRNQLTTSNIQNAYNISDIIKKSARYSMLLNRREDVYQIIKTVGKEKGVFRVRIYNKLGVIAFSSDSTEIGKIINMDAEECNVCHAKKELPSNLPWQNMIRIYEIQSKKRVIGLINPIKNETDCYTSDCHAHESRKAILGVLDVILTTEKMDEIISTSTKSILIGSVIITILIAVFSFGFIKYIVNKPLKEISKGIEQLSSGNLNYKISVNSKDELGLTATRFNDMSSKLDAAYNEIKEWSETLNKKVEEKNEELKKIYEQVVQIEKLASLGKLSATVAHELNNPLEGILTYSKLISKKISKQNVDGKFDDSIKFLNLVADESKRCGNIVKNLLLFSHQDEGPHTQHSLIDIIEKSITLINHHLELNKIKLIRDFGNLDILIYCDPQKIEQAFIAILINAIEAMSEGGTLTVSICKENGNALIRFIDQGKGINEKDLPYIFEPFFTTKKDQKGTGLGLSVTYGIIKKHKGEIKVEKTSYSGTTFLVSLPINKNGEN